MFSRPTLLILAAVAAVPAFAGDNKVPAGGSVRPSAMPTGVFSPGPIPTMRPSPVITGIPGKKQDPLVIGLITLTYPVYGHYSPKLITVGEMYKAFSCGSGSMVPAGSGPPDNAPVGYTPVTCVGTGRDQIKLRLLYTATSGKFAGQKRYATTWYGCDQVNGDTCTLTMGQPKTIKVYAPFPTNGDGYNG